MPKSLVSIGLLLFALTTACNDANFSGSNKTNPKAPPAAKPTSPPVERAEPKDSPINKTADAGPEPTDNQTPAPETSDRKSKSGLPRTKDLGEKGKNYHVGDGNYEGTSDKDKVGQQTVSGKIFKFSFTVTATTKAAIQVDKIYGVDLPSNFVTLFKGTQVVGGPTALYPTASTFQMAGLTLEPGEYVLEIESRPYEARGDRDDIVIDTITVESETPIKAGTYSTE